MLGIYHIDNHWNYLLHIKLTIMEEFFSNFFVYTIWGSVVWFWIATALFVLLLFVAEANEQGFAGAFALALYVGIIHFWGDVPWSEVFSWDFYSNI